VDCRCRQSANDSVAFLLTAGVPTKSVVPLYVGRPDPAQLVGKQQLIRSLSCSPSLGPQLSLRRAKDETIVTKVGPNLLGSPIDDGFWTAIDDLKIWRHSE
jgi:hypothetical protein